MSAATTHRSTPEISAILRDGAIATAAAAVVNVIIWALATGPLGIEVLIPDLADQTQMIPLQAGPVIGASLFGGIAGTVLYAIISRVGRIPAQAFTVIVAVATLLSLGPIIPLELGVAGAFVLAAMHVCVAAAILVTFRRR